MKWLLMSTYTLWFVLAGVLIGLEMLSGTFYLLIYGLALAFGGAAALLGLPMTLQLGIAALCAIAGTLWLRGRPAMPGKMQNDLDIGQLVTVASWQDGLRVRVRYRGCDWDGELQQALPQQAQPLYIHGKRGNVLLLDATPPAP